METNEVMDGIKEKNFIPKTETEVEKFLTRNPEWDGRGVIVAILDTGVDPGATGLQKTSDGKPKILDLIDCTGGGDVKMKDAIVESEIVVMGLQNRNLILSHKWGLDKGSKIKVGVKKLRDLYPLELVSRITKFIKKNDEATFDSLEMALRKQVKNEEIEAKLKLINDVRNEYWDPSVDVVSFIDANGDCNVVVDWDMTFDLTNQQVIRDYKINQEYFKIHYNKIPYEGLNVSVKIYEDDIISLVTQAGMHATHVASICAQNIPRNKELNGVAPGVQILSIKIGETRLGSMETQIALFRAIEAIKEYNVNVVNMSYGEAATVYNSSQLGHFLDAIREELTNRHNVVFVSSAGNEGPALSTLGAPGGISEGVGAYVTPSMMKAQYAQLKNTPSLAYTWSSRGPTTDGHNGVTIYAPGGAIAATPVYELHNKQLANGTSMSSPNCAGCIANLISACIANGYKYSVYRIARAIKNTGMDINNINGNSSELQEIGYPKLIQVQKAWDYLVKYNDHNDLDVKIKVEVVNLKGARGIYLRDLEDTQESFYANLKLTPIFQELKDDSDYVMNRFNLDWNISLISTADFVQSSAAISLNNAGRTFTVKVNPTYLTPGQVYYAEIYGYDFTDLEKGPLFSIPITVIKPIDLSTTQNHYQIYKDVMISNGIVSRNFFSVPCNANLMNISIKCNDKTQKENTKIMLHTVQLIEHKSFNDSELKTAISIPLDCKHDEFTYMKYVKVYENKTIEICLAQFWSNSGNTLVKFQLDFHGVSLTASISSNLSENALFMDPIRLVHNIALCSKIRNEKLISIDAKSTCLVKILKPIDNLTTIDTLSARTNKIDGGKTRSCYILKLVYQFSISDVDKDLEVRIDYPNGICNQLYESNFCIAFSTILDYKNSPVAYDEPKHSRWLKLNKSDYSLKGVRSYKLMFELGYTSFSFLEKFKGINIGLEIKLSGLKLDGLVSYKLVKDYTDGFMKLPDAKSKDDKLGANKLGGIADNVLPSVLYKNKNNPLYILPQVNQAFADNYNVMNSDLVTGNLDIFLKKNIKYSIPISYILCNNISINTPTKDHIDNNQENDVIELIKLSLNKILYKLVNRDGWIVFVDLMDGIDAFVNSSSGKIFDWDIINKVLECPIDLLKKSDKLPYHLILYTMKTIAFYLLFILSSVTKDDNINPITNWPHGLLDDTVESVLLLIKVLTTSINNIINLTVIILDINREEDKNMIGVKIEIMKLGNLLEYFTNFVPEERKIKYKNIVSVKYELFASYNPDKCCFTNSLSDIFASNDVSAYLDALMHLFNHWDLDQSTMSHFALYKFESPTNIDHWTLSKIMKLFSDIRNVNSRLVYKAVFGEFKCINQINREVDHFLV